MGRVVRQASEGGDRFDWHRMRDYWTQHARRAPVDRTEDPHALGNVCHPGQELAFNRYYALAQRAVFERLFDLGPGKEAAGAALDVGCGGGRWCELFADRGYDVVGIDLQEELIEQNRTLYPGIEFVCSSLQQYRPDREFDVVSSVTVLQHLPFDEQVTALSRLRELTRAGGHAIILENVLDQAVHVFSRSMDGWRRLFAEAGFRCLATRRYDYNPCLRLISATASLRSQIITGSNQPGGGSDTVAVSNMEGRLAHTVKLLRRVAIRVDGVIEPALIKRNAALPVVHCGFLFVAE